MAHHRNLASHPNSRSYLSGDERDFTPPHEESRSGRGEKAPRKRNSVACARCRKRKIKCTGDLRDGNGCEACQAAGTNPTSCFYLRVNSHTLEEFPLQSPPEPEWPYSSANSAGYSATVPRITTDPGQYALAGGNMLPPSTGTSYSMQTSGRAQAFDLASMPYAAALPRQSFSMNYQSNQDAVPSQYGLQLPRHGVPLQMSQTPSSNYPATEYPSHWSSLAPHSRPLPSTYSFLTEAPSSYQAADMSYMPHSGLPYPAGVAESTSIFPGLSPLASSLPFNGPSRTLPNPVSVQSSMHSSGGSVLESDSGMDTYPHQFTGRSSISSATRDAINASEGSNSTASSSPSDTHRSLNAGYGNLAYSSQVGSNASASSLPSGGVSRRVSNEIQESYSSGYMPGRSGIQTSQSGSSHLPNLNTPYSIQSMQGALGIQNESINSMASGGSSLGGLPPGSLPPGIHHPQPQHSNPQDVPPILKGTFDPTSCESRKRSISKTKGQKIQGKR